jgi:hypothetical protein
LGGNPNISHSNQSVDRGNFMVKKGGKAALFHHKIAIIPKRDRFV